MAPWTTSTYDTLMALTDVMSLSNVSLIQRIGVLIDLSGDLQRDDGITRALDWCDAVQKRTLSDSDATLVEYFRANAWATRQQNSHRDPVTVWEWEQPHLQKQVFHLRRAVAHPGFAKLPALRRCQIFTNLGNQLSTVGRFVEALEYWGRALAINPHFGMALGNRGNGLEHYARSLYDGGHQKVFCWFAHKDLTTALSPEGEFEGPHYEGAKAFFRERKLQLESIVAIEAAAQDFDLDGHGMGESDEEQQYRRWCLQNRLFLNPLNDLGEYPMANRDILMLPSFITAIGEPPTLIGFFNQMKQEFISGRWLFYEGAHSTTVHFSDKDVALYNTLDYPSYALAVEKVKAAYRIAYSLFDKIAFFINEYMKLGIKPKDVYFRSLWHKNRGASPLLIRDEFEKSQNWPFRGLYWLSKDLFDDSFCDVMEPDAQELHTIRNRLEHSYLKVHEMIVSPSGDASVDFWTDRLAYSVLRQDLETKTLRVLKLARAGLIYLSLGMHREERRRAKLKDNSKTMPMVLDLWDDTWKQ